MAEGAWLVAFVMLQRIAELSFAHLNTTRLIRQGGIEFGARHYPLIVATHACWLLVLWLLGHDRPVDPWWLLIFVLLQAGRAWVIVSLGWRWTTRVIVLPGERLVARGPYRYLKHPNYLIAAMEIAVVPLALGLPLVALAFTLANAALLAYRVHVENRALAWARSAEPLPIEGQNVS